MKMKIETSFEYTSKLITVASVVVARRGRSACRLVLDTGAVYTTIASDLADILGITRDDAIRATVIRSATGDERGYLVRLTQLTTLGLVFRNIEVDVADLGYGIDGLIGMNVLGGLNFEVRSAERRILVEKSASG